MRIGESSAAASVEQTADDMKADASTGELGSERVPQVMDAQAADARGFAHPTPVGFELNPMAAVATWKQILGVCPLAPCNELAGRGIQRDDMLCALFCCSARLSPNACFEIEVAPARRLDLAAPRAG